MQIYHSVFTIAGPKPPPVVHSVPELRRKTHRRLELRAGDEDEAEDKTEA